MQGIKVTNNIRDAVLELERKEFNMFTDSATIDMQYILDKTVGELICSKCVIDTGCSYCEDCVFVDVSGELTEFSKSKFNNGCDI